MVPRGGQENTVHQDGDIIKKQKSILKL